MYNSILIYNSFLVKSESFENRSSGRPPEDNGINGSRNLIRGLLMGLSAGVVLGVLVDRFISNEDKKPEDCKPVPCTVTPDDKPSVAYETLKERIDQMNKIKKAAPKWENKDTDVCEMSDDEILQESQDILDERHEKEALEFIAKLGITNQADKDRIIDTFLKGCTKIESVSKGSISLTREESDPGEPGEYIELEEKIEVPREYLDEEDLRQKTPEEVEMGKLIEDGKFGEALDSFDAEKILKTAQKEGLYALFDEIIKLMEDAKIAILSTDDPAEKKATFCRLHAIFALNMERIRIFDNYPDLKSADKLIFMFYESLGKLAEVENDEEECAMKGFECLQSSSQVILSNENPENKL